MANTEIDPFAYNPAAAASIFGELPPQAAPEEVDISQYLPQAQPMQGRSSSYDEAFQQAESQYGLPSGLLSTIGFHESRFNPNAVSPAGAEGLMQLMPPTAKEYGVNARDPYASIDAAGKKMSGLVKYYNGDMAKAVAAYNYGEGNLNRAIRKAGDNWISAVPRETQFYVSKVLGGQPQGQEAQGPQEDTYPIPLASGKTLYAPKGMPREEALASARAQGVDAVGLRDISLASGKTLQVPEHLTDEEAIKRASEAHPDIDFTLAKKDLGPRTTGGFFKDVGATTLKGVTSLAQSVIGLADIITPGDLGAAVENNVVDLSKYQDYLDKQFSPQTQEAIKNLNEAHGLGNILQAAKENPSAVLSMVGQAIPQMVGAAGPAKAALYGLGKLSTKATPAIASAIENYGAYGAAGAGEGLLGAGGAKENLREINPEGEATGVNTLAALGTGAGTALFGAVGSKATTALGGVDPTVMFMGGLKKAAVDAVGDVATTPGFFKSTLVSMVGEGVLEEAPQSAVEQMFQNYATNSPLLDGVPDSAFKGAVIGALMGGGANVGSRIAAPPTPTPTPEVAPPEAGVIPPEAETEVEEKEPVVRGRGTLFTPEDEAILAERTKGKKEKQAVEQVVAGAPAVEEVVAGAPAVEEVVPEPTVKAKKEKPVKTEPTWLTETLGLPESSAVYKRIASQGLDINNPEQHDAIDRALAPLSTNKKISGDQWSVLDQRMEAVKQGQPIPTPEIQNAQQIPSPSPIVRDGSTQPQEGQAVENIPQVGKGMEPSRQGEPIAQKGAEEKEVGKVGKVGKVEEAPREHVVWRTPDANDKTFTYNHPKTALDLGNYTYVFDTKDNSYSVNDRDIHIYKRGEKREGFSSKADLGTSGHTYIRSPKLDARSTLTETHIDENTPWPSDVPLTLRKALIQHAGAKTTEQIKASEKNLLTVVNQLEEDNRAEQVVLPQGIKVPKVQVPEVKAPTEKPVKGLNAVQKRYKEHIVNGTLDEADNAVKDLNNALRTSDPLLWDSLQKAHTQAKQAKKAVAETARVERVQKVAEREKLETPPATGLKAVVAKATKRTSKDIRAAVERKKALDAQITQELQGIQAAHPEDIIEPEVEVKKPEPIVEVKKPEPIVEVKKPEPEVEVEVKKPEPITQAVPVTSLDEQELNNSFKELSHKKATGIGKGVSDTFDLQDYLMKTATTTAGINDVHASNVKTALINHAAETKTVEELINKVAGGKDFNSLDESSKAKIRHLQSLETDAIKEVNDIEEKFGHHDWFKKIKEEVNKAASKSETVPKPKKAKPKAEAKPKEKVVTKPKVENAPEWAQYYATRANGTVVHISKGEKGKEMALIQGYNAFGSPTFTPAKEGARGTKDVESYKEDEFFSADELKTLIEAKNKWLEADKALHEANPNGPFKAGGDTAYSENVPENIKGVIEGWKKLMGIKERVYFTTINDAKSAVYHGPYAAIPSHALNEMEGGNMRKLSNGDFIVAYRPSAKLTQTLEIISHEMGHILEKTSYANADAATRAAIKADFNKWLASTKGKTAREHVESLRARSTGKGTKGLEGYTSEELNRYWRKEEEWFSDQVSRWATTTAKPVSIVEKFFSRLGKALRNFFLSNRQYLPTKNMHAWLDSLEGINISEGKEVKDTGELEQMKSTVGPSKAAKDLGKTIVDEGLVKTSDKKPIDSVKDGFELAKKHGTLTKLATGWIDSSRGLSRALSELDSIDVKGEMRADLIHSKLQQIYNLVRECFSEGYLVLSGDGGLMTKLDKSLALEHIFKRIDALGYPDSRKTFFSVMRVLAGESNLRHDAEQRALAKRYTDYIRVRQKDVENLEGGIVDAKRAKNKVAVAQLQKDLRELNSKLSAFKAEAKRVYDRVGKKSLVDIEADIARKEAVAQKKEALAAATADATMKDKLNKEASDLRDSIERLSSKIEGTGVGTEKRVTQEQIDIVKELLANDDRLEPIMADIYTALRKSVDLWEETGLIDADTADNWRDNPAYIPLYKSMDDKETDDMLNDPSKYVQMLMVGAKSEAKVHARKGGLHDVNVGENLVKHFAFMAGAAAQNQYRKIAAKQLEVVGAAKEIPTTINGKEVTPDDPQAVMFKEDGKKVYYHVSDPVAFEAFQTMIPVLGSFAKAAQHYTKFFRTATLVNPVYWYRQLIRDPLHANLVSRTGTITPLHALKAFAEILTDRSGTYKTLKRHGVVGAVDSISDPKQFVKAAALERGVVRKSADWVMRIHEAADAATRVAIFDKAVKEANKKGIKGQQAENFAAMRAREIINFSKKGNAQQIAAIRATVPFFSSQLNAMDTLARAAFPGKYGNLNKAEAAEAKKHFYANAAMLVTASMAFALVMQDDEEYQKSPDWVDNWLIPTGDKENPFWKIPIPFEAGFLFKVIPEAIIRMLSGTLTYNQGMKSITDAGNRLLIPSLPIPQILKPIAEVVANHDYHTGNPIENYSESRLPKEQRTAHASELSKLLGEALPISPDNIEHLGRGWATGAWAMSAALADAFLNKGVSAPEKAWSETYLGKGVLSKGHTDRALSEFYSAATGASQIHNAVMAANKMGDRETVDAIKNDPDKLKQFKASPALQDIGTSISAMQHNIKRIKAMKDTEVSPAEKAKRIRVVQDRINKLAQKALVVGKRFDLDI
jgi:hypothetical protein